MHKDKYHLPTRRLVSQDDAAIIERPSIPRSRFSGSWTRKTTFDAGWLIPFMVDEILPGDHMKYNVTAYIRMQTPLFPIFDNQRIDTFFFFVPNRLLWENWVKFMGEQDDPAIQGVYAHPYAATNATTGIPQGTLGDHMGLPTANQVIPPLGYRYNILPFRAYNQIYNAWFRDQNIIAKAPEIKTDGAETSILTNYVLRRRAKSHDYFTSALPWPQKFTAPLVPVAGLAPVVGLGLDFQNMNTTDTAFFKTGGGFDTYEQWSKVGSNPDPATQNIVIEQDTSGNPKVYADLSQATGVAINIFRQAFLVQALLERDARGGTRYTELIRSHFGVTNPDFRLQRPEYIGGGQSALQITPVAQTAPDNTPGEEVTVGALGAAATSVGQHRASYAATEHGFIIGLINVRTELSYQHGLHKMWSRKTRFDYYWPALAQLGEQAILMKELWIEGTANYVASPEIDGDADIAVFGYQERWHEYRTRYSEVTGLMNSFAQGAGLDTWHLAQRFDTAPTLSQTFIEDEPPMDRVLAAGGSLVDQQYLADIMIERTAVRPIPTFGTPALLGRF